MSYHVFFSFSTGLKEPITAPRGEYAKIVAHVAEVEGALGIKRTRSRPEDAEWWVTWDADFRAGFPEVEDEELCKIAQEHNDWVRMLYDLIGEWAKTPVPDGEEITPEMAAVFWAGLSTITVAPDRWTPAYYRNRMEHFYEVMRGRESEGTTWPHAAPLTEAQAGAVIWLFGFLDPGDARLEVAKGEDHLSDGDEYDWCERCGAMPPEDTPNCRQRGCPVQAEWCDEDRPEWFEEAE